MVDNENHNFRKCNELDNYFYVMVIVNQFVEDWIFVLLISVILHMKNWYE